MPLLDVTEVLSDPDFATTFTVMQNTAMKALGTNRNVITPTVLPNVVGVVEAAGSQDLQRLPEGEYQRGAIAIYTTFPLYSGGTGRAADTVSWNGNTYTVKTVDDWSQYGAGYVKVLASLTDLNTPP